MAILLILMFLTGPERQFQVIKLESKKNKLTTNMMKMATKNLPM